MRVRDQLPPILRGDAAADLTSESRAQLETLAQAARSEDLIVMVRDECAARLRQPGASRGVEYLLALVCALHGERERSLQTLLSLGEHLAAGAEWEPLAAVAENALEMEETAAGARLLVDAHEGLGRDPARIDALRRAWSILPDDLEIGLLVAVRLGEAGHAEERRALLADLAPRFAAEERYAGLEEAALEFVEHQDLDGLARVLGVLPEVVGKGALQEAKQLLDVAFPLLAKAGRAGEAEKALRELVARAGGAGVEPFRAALVEAIRQGSASHLPDAASVFAISGLDDRRKPLADALERFDSVAALAPGRAVLHGSFGAGRVLRNDGDNVVIDFNRSPGHRMPYAAARRTLTPLAEDDLRLMRFTDHAGLERLRKDEPGEFLVRTLRAIGGDADAQKLKLFVVGHGLVPANEWTILFRKLKAAAEKDPRIDHARAFEQVYRLAPEGSRAAAETPLPAIEPRKPVKTNLNTMRKFLAQHPGAEVALARRFGRYFERALLDPDGDRVDRARAGLYVARWFPERAADWPAILKSLWDEGLEVSDLSGEEEQLALLEISHSVGVEGDAILSALDSRFAAVREQAEEHRGRLDAAGRAALRRTLIDHAARYPQAALRLISEELDAAVETPTDELVEDAWRLLWAALSLIEERPKPSTAETVLEWIAAGGPFERRLETRSCPEQQRLRLAVLLRQWRSSDRYLFPALESAERVGLGDEVETVKLAREAKTRKLFDGFGEQVDVDLPIMTRATWERLQKELARMERELRIELPRTIQKARELGDLRENAEYHSAKLKQANLGKQVAALQSRLTRARFVDDVELRDGVVGPGTEVVLESDRDITTYWILGEDEHHHGAHVVSFQAPVGRALVGRAIGDEVTLEERRYRIVSVERKLPPAEETTPAR
jgi:transcription elongation factor GreA